MCPERPEFATDLSDDGTDPNIQQQPLPAELSAQQVSPLDRTPVRPETEQALSTEERRIEEQQEARFRMLQRLLETPGGKDSYLDTIGTVTLCVCVFLISH